MQDINVYIKPDMTQKKIETTDINTIDTKDSNNNQSDDSNKITQKKSINSLQTIHIDDEIKTDKSRNEEIISGHENLTLPKENKNALRERSISILTDDGAYDDLSEKDILQNDVEELYGVISAISPCEKQVVRIIIKGNEERLESLKEMYFENYNEELCTAVKSCTSGDVKSILTNVLTSTENYLASLLNGFLKSRDMVALTEVLTAWKPHQIQAAKSSYKELFGTDFHDDVSTTIDDTFTDSLKNIIIPLSHLQRNNMNVEDLNEQDVIDSEVDQLNEGGDKIVEVLTQRPYSNAQLAKIFVQYKLKFYLDLKESIELEFHDTSQQCLKAIVNLATNVSHYFAEELYNALNENDEARIIHIITSRYQSDLVTIGKIFDEELAEHQNDLNTQLKNFPDENVSYLLRRMVKKSKR